MTSIKVEPYDIHEIGIKIAIEGKVHRISKNDANLLYEALGNSLGKRPFPMETMKCNNRFSHGAHVEIKNGIIYYCRGLAYDRT